MSQQTKEAIILAALHIFAEQGFEAASLRDIAEKAHITHGTLRHYFGSKAGVWQAVVEFVLQRFAGALQPHIQQATQRQEDLLETIKRSIRSFLLVFAHHPEMAQLMLHEGMQGGARFDYFIDRFEQIDNTMLPLFMQAQQLGYLRQFDSQTFLLYLLTTGAAPFGLRALSLRFIGKDILADEQTQQHIDRVLATLFC
ncbi:TetR/AcrR family transcriptional regulator [Dictyobacter halimunensis]|uniref:TetR/AcrR family transcriptional regulator n=1 Tax=Dictyobacter halimunensis TaxID=3026934 RepID=UPI0030C770C2